MSEKQFLEYTNKIEKIGLSMRPKGPFDLASFQTIRKNIEMDLIPSFKEIVLSFLSSYSKKNIKFPAYNLEQIVNQISYKYNDYKRRVKNINYYKANALAFTVVIDMLLKNIDKKERENQLTEEYIREQWYSLSEMFFYSCVFIRDICRYIGEPLKFPIYWGERTENLIKTSMITQELLYGCCAQKSIENTKYTVALATIRLMIEVKIRRALGIKGFKTKESITHIPFCTIIKKVKHYYNQGDIRFAVPLDKVNKIYAMSNLYLHAAIRSYPWYPYVFYEYVKPLIQPNEWDLRAGIEIRRSALQSILNDIAETKELDCITDERYLAATFFD
ncbi:MAG: hypothetical protein E7006_01595 [Alphaproteobacteria bacterium]|nr:hypothetical protein [Alphaproteobacteria bacterium]